MLYIQSFGSCFVLAGGNIDTSSDDQYSSDEYTEVYSTTDSLTTEGKGTKFRDKQPKRIPASAIQTKLNIIKHSGTICIANIY